jgi:hypothetical protein
MKISTILTAVLALTISASAIADGGYRHPGNYVGNVSPVGNMHSHGGHGGGNALPWLIGGAVLGAIIVNETRDREPQVVYQPAPQVVYQQPQVVYQQEVARPAPRIVYVPSPYVCPNRNGQFINGVHYCPTYQ